MEQPKRDPRIDPQPGDILRYGSWFFNVKSRTPTAVYYGAEQETESTPLLVMSLTKWRKTAQNDEVVKVAAL